MLNRAGRVLRFPSTYLAVFFGLFLIGAMYVYRRATYNDRSMCLEGQYLDKHAASFNCTSQSAPCHWGEKPEHMFQVNCSNPENRINLFGNATVYAAHVLSPYEFILPLLSGLAGLGLGVLLIVLGRTFCCQSRVNEYEAEAIGFEPIVTRGSSHHSRLKQLFCFFNQNEQETPLLVSNDSRPPSPN